MTVRCILRKRRERFVLDIVLDSDWISTLITMVNEELLKELFTAWAGIKSSEIENICARRYEEYQQLLY